MALCQFPLSDDLEPGDREELARLQYRVEAHRGHRDATSVTIATASLYAAALGAFHAVTRTLPDRHVTLFEHDQVLARFAPAPITAAANVAAPPTDWAGQSPKLSARETEVLGHLLRGRSMKETARLLKITPRTVAFHKYRAMEANGLRNNAELITFAARYRLLPLKDLDQIASD